MTRRRPWLCTVLGHTTEPPPDGQWRPTWTCLRCGLDLSGRDLHSHRTDGLPCPYGPSCDAPDRRHPVRNR